MLHQITANIPTVRPREIVSSMTISPDLSKVRELKPEDTAEVLEFLSVRPVHTVVMTSFINDNGIESDLNRGKFYGYSNSTGIFEGVALIGHTTLVESRSKDALNALGFLPS